jgi:uncharacterized protein YjiS (DUF1127 family)
MLPLSRPRSIWRILRPRQLLHAWRVRRRYREDLRRLADLGPYLLHDIGLTKQQVAEEVCKPFWQP